MKTKNQLYEEIAQLRSKLYDAGFALMRCKNHAIVFKENALPTSKAGFEDIEKIAQKAQKDLAQNSIWN
jgi:hypothetical protein